MRILFILLTLLTGLNCAAQVYTAKSGSATFFSKAPVENIEASSNTVQSILNSKENTVAFIIPIRSFRFEKDLMQEHFNEKYMESDKYPNATYSGKINDSIDYSQNGTYEVTSTGKITIHGQEKEITTPGTLTINNNVLTVESKFELAVADFKIEIPKLLFKNIADTVEVKLNVNYELYKK